MTGMPGMIFEWSGAHIEDQARWVLRARGLPDPSLAACRRFARDFVQRALIAEMLKTRLPRRAQELRSWVPGKPLDWEALMVVGAKWQVAVAAARKELGV